MSDSDKDLTIRLRLDRSQAKQEQQAFVAAQKQAEQAVLAEMKAAETAKVALAQATARRRAAASDEAGDAEVRASEKARDSFAGLATVARSFAGQMIGLDSVKSVLHAITTEFDKARESAYQASKFVGDYREALLELAALKGQMGNTTPALRAAVAFRAATLQSAPDARNFQSAALGVGQAAITAGTISDAEFREAMRLGGQFQATEGGDARAHGQLVGLTPTLIGHATNAQEVFQRIQQYYKIFQPGGPEFSNLVQQFNGLAPMAAAGTYNDTELAALLSAFSTVKTTGGAAATAVEQFTRATLGGVDSAGKPRILNAETRGNYFRKLGITDEFLKKTRATALPFAIADQIVADLDAQQAAAAARGESFSPDIYLKHEGFQNIEDLEGLKLYGALKRSGQLEKSFLALARPEAQPTFDAAMKPIQEAQAREPVLLDRKAAYAEEFANIAQGAGAPEYVDQVMRLAFAARKARGEETAGNWDEIRNNRPWNSVSELLFRHQERTARAAVSSLETEALRLGYPGREVLSQFQGNGGTEEAPDRAIVRLGAMIRARGGNVLPGFDAVASAANRQLNLADLYENGAAGRGGAGGAGQEAVIAELKNIHGELQKQNERRPPDRPPAPLPSAPARPFR